MNFTPKQYVLALTQLLVRQEAESAKKTIDNFVRLLAANRDLGMAEKIIVELERAWNDQEGKLEAEIISARELNQKTLKSLADYLLQITAAKKISLIKKINADILGGAIVKYGDKVMDMSLKRRLGELKEQMVI